MFQNYVNDNIVLLRNPDVSDFFLLTGSNLSGMNGFIDMSSSSNNSSFLGQVDISDDSLFSFDAKISSQSVGASGDIGFVVCTYVASSPIASLDLQFVRCGFYSGLVIGDTITVSGRCVVPALSLRSGESQYIAIGLISTTNAAIPCTSKFLQARVHTEDIKFFQPMK